MFFLHRFLINTTMYFSYAYDDFLSVLHLTTRNALAQHLEVSYDLLYHGFTLYHLGFFISVILMNILSNVYSNRKIVFYSQISIVCCHILTTYSDISGLFVIRFVEGFSVSASIISMSILLNAYFRKKFSKFLAYYFIVMCLIEACVPFVSILSKVFHIRRVFFSVGFVALNCLYGFSMNKVRDVKMGHSVLDATMISMKLYRRIMNSRFVCVMFMIGISSGIPDYITSMFEYTISLHKQYLFPYLLSMMSLGTLFIIKIIDYISADNPIDIKFLIKMLMYLFTISSIIFIPTIFLHNPYISTFMKSILIGCMYAIECLCTQHMYYSINETASVTSTVLLANTAGSLISYIVGMFFSMNVSIFLLLMSLGAMMLIYNYLALKCSQEQI